VRTNGCSRRFIRTRLAALTLALLLGAAVLLGSPAQAAWVSEQITDLGFDCIYPSLHNGQIAFKGDAGNGIWFWDGTHVGGSPTPAVQVDTSGSHPKLYDGAIAYEISNGTWYWPGSGAPQYILAGRWPDLHDDKIAYVTSGSGYDIKLWDGVSSQTVANSSLHERDPDLYGSHVAYMATATLNQNRDIYFWDGSTHQITNTPGLDELYPSVYDGQLAWIGHDGNDYEIFFRTDALNPATQIQITNNPYDDEHTTVWEGKVAWQYWDGNDWEIMFWNGSSIEQVTDNDLDDIHPNLHGGMIAYTRPIGAHYQIMLARIPEPSLLALSALGLLALLRRRKR